MGNFAHRNICQQLCNIFSTAKKYLATALLPSLALLATLTLTSASVWADAVVATFPIGSGNTPLAVNPTTNIIYVTSPDIYGGLNSVKGFNPDGTSDGSSFAVGTDPLAIAVNPVTNKIYVADDIGNFVTVIDVDYNTTTTVMVGTSPTAIAVNPVTNKIYVANKYSNDVTVIDGDTGLVTGTVGVGNAPIALAVKSATATSPTNMIYVANSGSNDITVIDGADNSILTTIPNVKAGGHRAIAANSVTNLIYVAGGLTNNITVIDGGTNSIYATVATGGINATAIAINQVTNVIYVTNLGGNDAYGSYFPSDVTVIDGTSRRYDSCSYSGNIPVNFPGARRAAWNLAVR